MKWTHHAVRSNEHQASVAAAHVNGINANFEYLQFTNLTELLHTQVITSEALITKLAIYNRPICSSALLLSEYTVIHENVIC